MLLITLRGTPFLFQGDELGLPDVPVPPERRVDVDGRDPQRAPLPWEPPSSAGPGAGFTRGRPWLPMTAEAEALNARTQAADPRSTLALHRALLALRRSERALQDGTQRWLAGGPDVLAYEREHGGRRLLVALNFADAPREALLGDGGRAQVEVCTGMDRPRGSPVDLAGLRLGPDEGLVLRRLS